ncbi:HI_0552 family protein [Enterococcus massiliensis]|uniref:HI_0552 family protein n=1 Tax=Enterococcus massiliensis TaxID=1640685 RepID=UPI00065DFC1A|nr:HI_0552 family protein [Enterococcus massiliensis]
MELTNQDFQLFDRETFAFKQLKLTYTEAEIEQLKNEYKTVWDKWKEVNLASKELLTVELGKPKIESWTNGWNLRNHFWCALRGADRLKQAPCLAVLLNKKNLQIYLMYQHYKSDEKQLSKKRYNQLLEELTDWSKTIDETTYFIWSNEESELNDHLPLADYLALTQRQQKFTQGLEASTFQLGVQLPAGEIKNVEQKIATYLTELYPLYQKLVD